MSDIRFNRWLHQSGTGGIHQDSSGNIGIGTSVPTVKVDIQGGDLKVGDQLFSSSGVSTFSSGLNVTSGSVGIGIDNPNEKLEVAANSSHRISVRATDTTMSDNGDYGGFCWYTNDASNPNRKNWEIYQKAAGSTGTTDLHINSFSTNDIVVIDSAGNIGIGTDNPDTLLNLFGTGNTTIKVHNDSATVGTYSRLQLLTGGPGSSARSEIRSLRMSTSTAATDLAFLTTTAGDTIPTERLIITSNGRISINNTSGPTDIPGTAHDTLVIGNPTAISAGVTLEVASGENCGFQMYAQGSQPAARFLYYGTDNQAQIWLQNSGGASEAIRMRFHDTGNVSIEDGNLVLASGHGIDFSATSDGGTTTPSELLDDYEEGTWTPDLKFGGNSDGMTYSRQEGHYTKIGRQVFALFRLTLTSKGTSTGQLRIYGLPFTAADVFTSTGIDGNLHIAHDDGFNSTNTSNNPVSGYVEGGTDYILMTARNSSAALSTMDDTYVDSDWSIAATVIYYA